MAKKEEKKPNTAEAEEIEGVEENAEAFDDDFADDEKKSSDDEEDLDLEVD